MPELRGNGQSLSFVELKPLQIRSLPFAMQKAAGIILAWQQGESDFIIETSGSTGKPKPIKLERSLMEHSARLSLQALGITDKDVLLCCMSTSHIAGLMMVVRAVVGGNSLVVAEPSANPLKDIDPAEKIDFAAFVPLQMESIIASGFEGIRRLNSMKVILLGGGVVSDALLAKIKMLHVPVFHSYGMTETYTHVALRRLNGPFASVNYQPLPGVDLSLDERGCLVIRAKVTHNEPLVTNDIIELHKDGSFRWLGRWDNVINSGGIKIQLEKVEQAVSEALPGAVTFFAAGLPDERLGQKLVLVIEGDEWPQETQTQLLEKLKAKLDKYEVPKTLLFTPSIECTPTAKIDRTATLRKMMLID